MVTQIAIRISPKAQPPPAAAAEVSSAAAIVAEESAKRKKPKAALCNHPRCTRRAQHPAPLCWMHGAQDVVCKFSGCDKRGILSGLCPDHGGLVQLCRSRGCINQVNLEKRGGLCWMHRSWGEHVDDSSSEEEEEDIRLCHFRGCISVAATDEGLCDGHSRSTHVNKKRGKNKRAHSSEDSISDEDTRKRQAFAIDLEGVPPQPAIPKSSKHIKDGSSKYTGVSFNKHANKWGAKIRIDGKQHFIGLYENEEEAAVDYARALFKYGERQQRQHRESTLDLSGVPPQPAITKSSWRIKDGSSKYTGVSFHKQTNKWVAKIMIDGKQHSIRLYENEEEAAVDYAHALFRYKGQVAVDKALEQSSLEQHSLKIDLTGVPPQPLIPKRSSKRIKHGASKYTGVSFDKPNNKWRA